MPASTERRLGLAFAAGPSLILGVYGTIAAASLLGIAAGAFSGAMGAMISIAVLTDHPGPRARRVAKIGLALSALALTVCVAVVVAIWISEI